MATTPDWVNRIGRRLRLRDLHVFFAVIQTGSMAKAAAQLRVTQPAVSKAITDLEGTLGVRLFDRSPQGVTTTVYGDALNKSGTAAFDELRQGIRSIEFLADPTAGELTIGCPESIAASILPEIIRRFSRQYPRALMRVEDVASPSLVGTALQERRCDLVFARIASMDVPKLTDDLTVEYLFDDELIIAAGANSRWARRRKVELSEIADEPWILMAPHTYNYLRIKDAFAAKGLEPPKVRLMTYSVHLRTQLLMDGLFITALPRSAFRFNAEHMLKALPIELPSQPWPVAVATLQNRTLSPVVSRFIECAREVAKSANSRRP